MAETDKFHLGMMIIGIIGPLAMLYFILRRYPVDAWTFVGLAIFFPSLVLWTIAHFQLGKSFAVKAHARELVTRGIYSKIRHPIYLFGLLLLLSLIICVRKPLWLVPWGMIVAMQIVRAKKEERALEDKFGEAFREYKRKTWY